MKICKDCYHCIEINEEEEHFLICALHNSEVEEGSCGFYEKREEQE